MQRRTTSVNNACMPDATTSKAGILFAEHPGIAVTLCSAPALSFASRALAVF